MVRVLPYISELSAHAGGNNGHRIKVKGTGFTSSLDEYSCKAAGEICKVT